MLYTYVDAINLALDMHRWEPEKYPDTDALATELWQEMQAENNAR